MDLREFQTTVKTTLQTELGTFPNGRPAIWVDSGEAIGQVTGLLCIIERIPNMISHAAIMNRQAAQHFDRVLKLVQYDRTPAGYDILDLACCKLRMRFPNHRERAIPPIDGSYPQVTFLCNFHALLYTY